ncbi:membrane-bound transcription factor site-2 protease-like isoform X2 [Varroa jacobsoni]|uniref:Membrane-bound transcription factor site-2 protease n=1 Tax=Varroa destructor TaxID=109461 RepID=A0A7M7MCA1_VARDE|nr:membrane-bound transcription factor site-2 protease-like isoform X2 [Varroa destructor]XP_022709832.1 membrane-bound transcription factor site-2 protease-like isoform X2 [Varroa jacobsoni]
MLAIIVITLSVWTLFNLLDVLLKSCMVRPYLDYLRHYNFNVKLFRIQWYTTRLNRYFNAGMPYSRKPLQSLWFDIGIVATLILCPIACFLLTRTFVSLLWEILYVSEASDASSGSSGSSSSMDLTPALPGINLPFSDLPFYIATLIICSVLHEFGHALAASKEGVRINGVGAFVVVVFPGAYVDLPVDPLTALPPWRRLRILCGGVWHNLVIAAVAWALLASNPVLLSPVFRPGVAVVSVDGSISEGAAGPGGLWPGDEVTAINHCEVRSTTDWESCLGQYVASRLEGGCLPRNFVLGAAVTATNFSVGDQKGSKRSCCSPGVESSTDLCFSLQPELNAQRECLPVRRSLQKLSVPCRNSSSCAEGSEVCATPILAHPSHRLLIIKRANVRQDMLFVGPPEELWKAVRVIQYVPRAGLSLASSQTIYYWETLLRYLVSFSGALAILNAMPCHTLDGHWIVMVLIELILGRSNPSLNRHAYNVLTFTGTTLIGLTVTLGLKKLFYFM